MLLFQAVCQILFPRTDWLELCKILLHSIQHLKPSSALAQWSFALINMSKKFILQTMNKIRDD